MSLDKEVRRTTTLQQAWFSIRDNARTSKSSTTKLEAREFEQKLPLQIRKLQDGLRKGYRFSPPVGVLIPKKSGGGHRGLVVSPLPDRVVQRAILDVLQRHDSRQVQAVMEAPTSFGGIPGRGVQDAIYEIERVRSQGGAVWLAGSDISGFFTKIEVAAVVDFVRQAVQDEAFTTLFRDALAVELANAAKMSPKDLELFPQEGIGVAQGCPLSALAGNIFLRDFDAAMNKGEVRCLRYIDDFILLCSSEAEAHSALAKAKQLLNGLGLTVYDPIQNPRKAFLGPFSGAIQFLGHRMEPGRYPPTEENIKSLLRGIQLDIAEFYTHTRKLLKGRCTSRRQSFVATVSSIDQRILSWCGAFCASSCEDTARRIDEEIDKMIAKLIDMYVKAKKAQAPRRKLFGVHSVLDGIRLLD